MNIVDNLATSPIKLLTMLLDGKYWMHNGYKVVVREDLKGHLGVFIESWKFKSVYKESVSQRIKGKPDINKPTIVKEIVYLNYDITLKQFLNAMPNFKIKNEKNTLLRL